MTIEDKERGESGVVLSMLDLPDGKIRVYMDDVKNNQQPSKGPWSDRGSVTWKDYKQENLLDLDLSQEELAGLGHYVLARLLATRKHPFK